MLEIYARDMLECYSRENTESTLENLLESNLESTLRALLRAVLRALLMPLLRALHTSNVKANPHLLDVLDAVFNFPFVLKKLYALITPPPSPPCFEQKNI